MLLDIHRLDLAVVVPVQVLTSAKFLVTQQAKGWMEAPSFAWQAPRERRPLGAEERSAPITASPQDRHGRHRLAGRTKWSTEELRYHTDWCAGLFTLR